MTTPPTTAGWYPDPDGSGGQRYWDGAEWTAQRPDAPDTTEETSAWPAELPPWPDDMLEMPSWEDAGKAEPPSEEPEEPEAVAAVEPSEPTEPAESVEPVDRVDAVDVADVVEPAEPSQPEPPAPVYEAPAEPRTEPMEPPAHLTGPPVFGQPHVPAAAESGGSRAKVYLIGAGALVAVLVAVLVWAFAGRDSSDTNETNGADGTSEVGETTAPATDSADQSSTPAEAATGAGGQVIDGDVTITSNGVEITPTVSAVENEMLTKSAAGEFVVVRLTLLNNGQLPATFLADQQILTAGGQTYTPETESTFYLGGISAVLYPGQPVDVAFAFDVPAGTAPESLEVHGDLASEGGVLALS